VNILILNYEFPPLGGGASPVSYEIGKELVRRGHAVHVFTMGRRGLPREETVDGIRVHRVPALRAKVETCETHEMMTYVISAILHLPRLLRRHRFDVVHCHFLIPTGPVALWIRRYYGLPFIVTAHGSDIPGYNPDRFTLEHHFTRPVIRAVLARAHAVTTPSEYLRNLIHANVGSYDVHVIANGSRDYWDGMRNGKKIIMAAGRFLPRKGFARLLEAFRRLPHDGWELLLVGDGPDRDRLKRLAHGDPNVHFTGWLRNDGPEYRYLLNEAQIFALPSNVESQGIAFIEAMSARCAIIGSDSTAVTETVPPTVGYRVPLDSDGQLERALSSLMEDEQLRHRLLDEARRVYESRYRYDVIVDEYEWLLNAAARNHVLAAEAQPST
jgi:glycosyltransferase involved in cell wall biosynthesis